MCSSQIVNYIQSGPEGTDSTGSIISKIEVIISDICDALLNLETLSIPLKTKGHCPQPTDPAHNDLGPSSHYKTTFPCPPPSSSAASSNYYVKEARRFTILLRLLSIIHSHLSTFHTSPPAILSSSPSTHLTETTISKRSIYYQDPQLFGSQAVVDRYIDILAYTFECKRADLGISAAAKGLVCGEVILRMKSGGSRRIGAGEVGDRDGKGAWLIGDLHNVVSVFAPKAEWILVVEKEATFRTITTIPGSSALSDTATDDTGGTDCSPVHVDVGQGIILTAKGYPDLLTRQFLSLLAKSHPHLPIFTLTDYDPDGFAIEKVYKHGSENLAHEQGSSLAHIKRLGVRYEDIVSLVQEINRHNRAPVFQDEIEYCETEESRQIWQNGRMEKDIPGIMPLSVRDRKKGTNMLKLLKSGHEDEAEMRMELQKMLMLGYKAEMEIFGERLGSWFRNRLMDEMRQSPYH